MQHRTIFGKTITVKIPLFAGRGVSITLKARIERHRRKGFAILSHGSIKRTVPIYVAASCVHKGRPYVWHP